MWSACTPTAPSPWTDGSLRKGEPVEYLSATYGRWIPATVEELNADGSVSLDVKPRADPSM